MNLRTLIHFHLVRSSSSSTSSLYPIFLSTFFSLSTKSYFQELVIVMSFALFVSLIHSLTHSTLPSPLFPASPQSLPPHEALTLMNQHILPIPLLVNMKKETHIHIANCSDYFAVGQNLSNTKPFNWKLKVLPCIGLVFMLKSRELSIIML